MVNQLLFLYCALVIIGTALLSVRFKNPVYSVLAVLVLFFHMAGLYLLLNAEFLAAIQIIVYAGAILVLYLFVLFLVNLKQEVKVERGLSLSASDGEKVVQPDEVCLGEWREGRGEVSKIFNR